MVVTFQEIDDVHLSSESEQDDEVVDKKSKKKQHKKLIQDIDVISGATKKRSKKTKRNEPSQDVSEFSWSTSQSSDGKVGLNDLVSCLETDTQKVASMKKRLRSMEKSNKVLHKPLHKPEQQRIDRTVAFEETSKDVSKWHSTVQKNREAEQLSFPLQSYQPAKPTVDSLVTFKPQNDLEREISEVLKGSQHLLERKNKELTADEEKALKNFDLQEALERRKELQKMRALQSYYEAKCRRQKKIKSKKYHRILKKEKLKALSKVDLETLSKDNPELFQNELEKAEKLRAMERANLRHRNSSKWAKNLITKGKPNKEDQERIREQLRISRQLTDHKMVSDSEDENEKVEKETAEDDGNIKLLTNDLDGMDNPWLLGNKKHEEDKMNESEKGEKLKRPEAIITIESKQKQDMDEDDEEDNEEEAVKSSADEWDTKEEIKDQVSSTKKRKSKKKKLKETKEPAEIIYKIKSSVPKKNVVSEETEKENKKQIENEKIQSDGLRFLKSDTDVIQIGRIESESDDNDDNDEDEQRMNIREAFANDDVIEEFVQEKESIIEQSKPKQIDLTLPGWGEWGGAGLKISERKRKKFIKSPGAQKKRRDDDKSNVIISEARNKALAKHQVSHVPFPYSNKEEFERSIRQPIGDQWNTPAVHEKLIEPRISVTSGTIIDPIRPGRKMKKNKKKGQIGKNGNKS